MASKKPKQTFPALKRVYPSLLISDLVSVQPMSKPSGLIFYTDFVYDDTPEQKLIKEKQKIRTTLDSIIEMDNQENKV